MNKRKKTKQVYFRMSDDELDDLNLASYFANMTKSEFVRRALRFYFNMKKHAPELLEEMERELQGNE